MLTSTASDTGENKLPFSRFSRLTLNITQAFLPLSPSTLWGCVKVSCMEMHGGGMSVNFSEVFDIMSSHCIRSLTWTSQSINLWIEGLLKLVSHRNLTCSSQNYKCSGQPQQHPILSCTWNSICLRDEIRVAPVEEPCIHSLQIAWLRPSRTHLLALSFDSLRVAKYTLRTKQIIHDVLTSSPVMLR